MLLMFGDLLGAGACSIGKKETTGAGAGEERARARASREGSSETEQKTREKGEERLQNIRTYVARVRESGSQTGTRE